MTLKTLKTEKPVDIYNAVKIEQNFVCLSLKNKKKSNIAIQRDIRVSKIGGFLPLIPILTPLFALALTDQEHTG